MGEEFRIQHLASILTKSLKTTLKGEQVAKEFLENKTKFVTAQVNFDVVSALICKSDLFLIFRWIPTRQKSVLPRKLQRLKTFYQFTMSWNHEMFEFWTGWSMYLRKFPMIKLYSKFYFSSYFGRKGVKIVENAKKNISSLSVFKVVVYKLTLRIWTRFSTAFCPLSKSDCNTTELNFGNLSVATIVIRPGKTTSSKCFHGLEYRFGFFQLWRHK